MKKMLMTVAAVLFASHIAYAAPIDLGIWDPLGSSDPRADGNCDVSGGSPSDELECLNESVLPAAGLPGDATFGTADITQQGGVDFEISQPITITLDVSDFDYLKLKWDGLWQYYDLNGTVGEVTFNSTVFNKQGSPQALSHYTFFSPRNGVPDGGSTAALLGSVLFAVGVLRRRYGKS